MTKIIEGVAPADVVLLEESMNLKSYSMHQVSIGNAGSAGGWLLQRRISDFLVIPGGLRLSDCQCIGIASPAWRSETVYISKAFAPEIHETDSTFSRLQAQRG